MNKRRALPRVRHAQEAAVNTGTTISAGGKERRKPSHHAHALRRKADEGVFTELGAPHPPSPWPRPWGVAPFLRPSDPFLTSLPATKQPNMAAATPLGRQGPEVED